MKRIKSIFRAALILPVIFTMSNCYAFGSKSKETSDNQKISSYQYMKKINSVFDFVEENYVDELDPKILYEGALKGMLEAIGDPHTVYLDSDYMRDLNDTTAGAFGGVGLTITKAVTSTPEKPAYVEVSTPLEDSPGAKAGIQAGDLIIAVEGKPTPDMTMNEVLAVLRGEVGTPVTITILRGTSMRFDVTLVRALIEVPTVKYAMIEQNSKKIGYVRLIQFTPETAHRMQDALDEFEKTGYDCLILDLRDNPGGLITSAVDVADKFIDEGPVVTTKSRLAMENQQFTASAAKTTVKKNTPCVVLINRGSASASEIVSGALKDYHLAYLVGERTYGKGSVQQVITLSETDGIKITMARYYTPSDVNIDKIGIPPDYEVKNLEEFTEEEEKTYVKLMEDNVIEDYVSQNPGMNENAISRVAEKLSETYKLDERILRKLLRNQVLRNQTAPVYDLDYDLQLNEAIKIVTSENYSELLQNTKTLKQLQDEVVSETQEE